jgi:hypothetical protein
MKELVNRIICKVIGHRMPYVQYSFPVAKVYYQGQEITPRAIIPKSQAWRCPRCNRLVFNKSKVKIYGN